MLKGNVPSIPNVNPGDPVRASHINAMSEAVRNGMTTGGFQSVRPQLLKVMCSNDVPEYSLLTIDKTEITNNIEHPQFVPSVNVRLADDESNLIFGNGYMAIAAGKEHFIALSDYAMCVAASDIESGDLCGPTDDNPGAVSTDGAGCTAMSSSPSGGYVLVKIIGGGETGESGHTTVWYRNTCAHPATTSNVTYLYDPEIFSLGSLAAAKSAYRSRPLCFDGGHFRYTTESTIYPCICDGEAKPEYEEEEEEDQASGNESKPHVHAEGDDDDHNPNPTTNYPLRGIFPGNIGFVKVVFDGDYAGPTNPEKAYVMPTNAGDLVSLQYTTDIQAWQILFIPLDKKDEETGEITPHPLVIRFPPEDSEEEPSPELEGLAESQHVRFCIVCGGIPVAGGSYTPPPCKDIHVFEEETEVKYIGEGDELVELDAEHDLDLEPETETVVKTATLTHSVKEIKASIPSDAISGVAFQGEAKTAKFVTGVDSTATGTATVTGNAGSLTVSLTPNPVQIPSSYKLTGADQPREVSLEDVTVDIEGLEGNVEVPRQKILKTGIPIQWIMFYDENKDTMLPGTGEYDAIDKVDIEPDTDAESLYEENITIPPAIPSASQTDFDFETVIKNAVLKAISAEAIDVPVDVPINLNININISVSGSLDVTGTCTIPPHSHTGSVDPDTCDVSIGESGELIGSISGTASGDLSGTAEQEINQTASTTASVPQTVYEFDSANSTTAQVYKSGGICTFDEASQEQKIDIKVPGVKATPTTTKKTITTETEFKYNVQSYGPTLEVVTSLEDDPEADPLEFPVKMDRGTASLEGNGSVSLAGLGIEQNGQMPLNIPSSGTISGTIESTGSAEVTVTTSGTGDALTSLPTLESTPATAAEVSIGSYDTIDNWETENADVLSAVTGTVTVTEYELPETHELKSKQITVGGCGEEQEGGA